MALLLVRPALLDLAHPQLLVAACLLLLLPSPTTNPKEALLRFAPKSLVPFLSPGLLRELLLAGLLLFAQALQAPLPTAQL